MGSFHFSRACACALHAAPPALPVPNSPAASHYKHDGVLGRTCFLFLLLWSSAWHHHLPTARIPFLLTTAAHYSHHTPAHAYHHFHLPAHAYASACLPRYPPFSPSFLRDGAGVASVACQQQRGFARALHTHRAPWHTGGCAHHGRRAWEDLGNRTRAVRGAAPRDKRATAWVALPALGIDADATHCLATASPVRISYCWGGGPAATAALHACALPPHHLRHAPARLFCRATGPQPRTAAMGRWLARRCYLYSLGVSFLLLPTRALVLDQTVLA